MHYIISLKMDEERRVYLNNYVSDMADQIIIWSAYVPLILVVCTLYQIIIDHMNVWFAFCKFISYVSVVGIVIMVTDAVDNWLSMTWENIEEIDKKKGLYRKILKSTWPILCWVTNLFMFRYLGGLVR